MPAITGFEVTYGPALAPAGFHRVTKADGGTADLSKGSGKEGQSASSFLWYHDSAGRGESILNVKVLHDEEPLEAGWEKVNRPLVKGSTPSSYLCIQRSEASTAMDTDEPAAEPEVQPIGEVVVAFGEDVPPSDAGGKTVAEEWVKVDRPLALGDGSGVFLWYRRTQPGEAPAWSPHQLKVGDWVDAKDRVNKWCVAQITAATADAVTVQYKGWANGKWDETISKNSAKLAPLSTHTGGKDTGRSFREQGGVWEVDTAEIDAIAQRMYSAAAGELPPDQCTMFLSGDLTAYIEKCLTSSFADAKVALPAVNSLLMLAAELVVGLILSPGPIPPWALQLLLRVCDCDPRCSYYYVNYGATPAAAYVSAPPTRLHVAGAVYPVQTQQSSDEGVSNDYEGLIQPLKSSWYASTGGGALGTANRLYHANLAHFCAVGGFDAILRRIGEDAIPTGMSSQALSSLAEQANSGEQRRPRCSLGELSTFMVCLKGAQALYESRVGDRYFDALQKAIFGRLGRLTPEELREGERQGLGDQLEGVLKDVQILLPIVIRGCRIDEWMEQYKLDLCLQLLACPYLNPRIRGITILNDIIEAAQRAENAARNYGASRGGYYYKQTPPSRWITAPWLAQWLEDNNAVELVLGECRSRKPSGISGLSSGTNGTPTPAEISAVLAGPPPPPTSSSTSASAPAHIEILKRSKKLLIFMALKRKLSLRHLDLLWAAASSDNQEAMQRGVYKIVGNLTTYIPHDGLVRLYEHLCSLPSQLEVMHVDLAKQFADAAIQAAESASQKGEEPLPRVGGECSDGLCYGLDILWRAAHGDILMAAEVAVDALAELLNNASKLSAPSSGHYGGGFGTNPRTDQLKCLLQLCITNLKSRTSVARSLRVAQRLIAAQPYARSSSAPPASSTSAAMFTRDRILMELERSECIIQTVVSELLEFRDRVKVAAAMSVDPMEEVLEGKETYASELQARLDFLAFVALSGPPVIPYTSIAEMWGGFVGGELCPTEREVFFRWLRQIVVEDNNIVKQQALASGLYVAMKKDDIYSVFKDLVCGGADMGVDWTRAGEEEYLCLEFLIRTVNSDYISSAASGPVSTFSNIGNNNTLPSVLVSDFVMLNGIDTLWEAALQLRGEAASACSSFLVQLHLKLHLKLIDGQPQARSASKDFVEKCMDSIEVALEERETGHSIESDFTIERALALLASFLTEAAHQQPTISSVDRPNASYGDSSIVVRIKEETDTPVAAGVSPAVRLVTEMVLKVGRGPDQTQTGVTVGMLRARISQMMRVPANRVRLAIDRRTMQSPLDDALFLSQANGQGYYEAAFCEVILARAPSRDTVNWRPPAHARASAFEAELDQTTPPRLLAHSKRYFPLLCRLLNLPNTPLADAAWDLLSRLPTNSATDAELRGLGGWLEIPSEVAARTAAGLKGSPGGFPPQIIIAQANRAADERSAREEENYEIVPGNVPWKKLLDGSDVPQLLYRLRIVFSFVQAATDEFALPGDKADGTAWSHAFTQQGGQQHLLSLLLKDEGHLDATRRLHKACLAALLRLIAHVALPSHIIAPPAMPHRIGAGGGQMRGDWKADDESSSDSDRDVIRTGAAAEASLEDTAQTEEEQAAAQEDKEREIAEMECRMSSLFGDDRDLPALMQRLLTLMADVSRAVPPPTFAALSEELTASSTGVNAAPVATSLALFADEKENDVATAEVGRSATLPPEAEVVQHTMSLLAALTQYRPRLLDAILDFPDLEATLRYGLLGTMEESVKTEVRKGVLRMAKQPQLQHPSMNASLHEPAASFFLQLLLHLLPRLAAEPPPAAGSREFFKLAAELCMVPGALDEGEARMLAARTVADLIMARPPGEATAEEKDVPLGGMLHLLHNIIQGLKDKPTDMDRLCRYVGLPVSVGGLGMVTELFDKCLFSLPKRRINAAARSSRTSSDTHKTIKEDSAAHEHTHTHAYDASSHNNMHDNSINDSQHSVNMGVDDGQPGLPKAKSTSSRSLAFQTLAALAKGSSKCRDMCVKLAAPHHNIGLSEEQRSRLQAKEERRLQRRSSSIVMTGTSTAAVGSTLQRSASFTRANSGWAKHPSGYAGLKNPGCICYMNSTLQQFFMVPRFRAAVLEFDAEASCTADERDESLMWQLQEMFSHLQESEKAYYNAKGFCHAFKDWDGNPTDLLVQQDASEFVTMFMQQLELRVMGTPSDHMLKDSFGGIFSNELLAEGGRRSETPEDFYLISVAVKDVKSLYAALEKFVEGEMVDYKWEAPVKKLEEGDREVSGNSTTSEKDKDTRVSLPTLKRITIKELPRHLIIHLKRFEFDFSTMQQMKINDRFEFPMDLDMFPYTVEGRAAAEASATAGGGDSGEVENDGNERDSGETTTQPPPPPTRPASYYQYRLAGVVVHMGTAMSGHYYSYIRERGGSGRWLEFNDSFVADFDPAGVENECFGGEEATTYSYGGRYNTSDGKTSSFTRERIRNAFMLVYDRVGEDELCPDVSGRFRAHVPEPIMKEIYSENSEFWRKRNVHDKRYYRFLNEILLDPDGSVPFPPSPASLLLAGHVALGTLVQGGEAGLVDQWCTALAAELPKCPSARDELLELLRKDVVSLHALVLPTGAAGAAPAALLRSLVAVSSEQNDTVSQFALHIVSLLPAIQENWRLVEEYSQLLLSYARRNPASRDHLLHHGCLTTALEIFATCASEPSPTVQSTTSTSRSTGFSVASQCAAVAKNMNLDKSGSSSNVIGSAGRDSAEYTHLLHLTGYLAIRAIRDDKLTDKEEDELYSEDFMRRLLREGKAPLYRSPLKGLLPMLTRASRTKTVRAVDIACDAILMSDDASVTKPYFKALTYMLTSTTLREDGLDRWRVNEVMGRLFQALYEQRLYTNATDICLELLLRLFQRSRTALDWLVETASINPALHNLIWIDQYLKERENNTHLAHGSGRQKAKPRAVGTSTSSLWNQSSVSTYPPHPSHPQPKMTREVYRNLLRGHLPPDENYDSDSDPLTLIGRSIEIRWQGEQYWKGRVTAFYADTGKHHVAYDDGDQKEYILTEKNWRFTSRSSGT